LGFVTLLVKAVIERQLPDLRRRRLGQPFLPKAQRDAPQPRHPFDILPSVFVGDMNAVAAGHNQRPVGLVGETIGVGMKHRCGIPRGEGVGLRHVNYRLSWDV